MCSIHTGNFFLQKKKNKDDMDGLIATSSDDEGPRDLDKPPKPKGR